MTSQSHASAPLEVSVEVAGTKHTGRYDVQGGMVTVYSPLGRKSTALGTAAALVLATRLLKEMIADRK